MNDLVNSEEDGIRNKAGRRAAIGERLVQESRYYRIKALWWQWDGDEGMGSKLFGGQKE